jgi:hypothetical protein
MLCSGRIARLIYRRKEDDVSPEPSNKLSGLGELSRIAEALGPKKPEPDFLSGALAALASLVNNPAPPQTPPIQGRWFNNQTINIDGYTFEGCRFDQCSLVTSMATFTLRDCYIAPTCSIFFDGPTLKVVRLLMHDLTLKGRIEYRPAESGLYPPVVTPDGRFTLE